MRLPTPRGSLSEALVDALRRDGPVARSEPDDATDAQLCLWILYELHYRGFTQVPAQREWDPRLVGLRTRLEGAFEEQIRTDCAPVLDDLDETAPLVDQLTAIAGWESEESLARFLQREATRDQYLEFLVQRSLYHLKESDPHAWVLPRIDGAAKTALAELLHDEFGSGRPEQLHSRLYAEGLASVDLVDAYGNYVDVVATPTLAVNNVMSLFGLNRRMRGAAMGHLALFEMTSSLPCRRYLQGAQRLDLPGPVQHYFDEHVEADAIHEHLAARGICGALVDAEPELRRDVLLGAAACAVLDGVAGDQMVSAWRHGRSSLTTIADGSAA